MTISIRQEQPSDSDRIAELTKEAFLSEPHSSHTEQFILNTLRREGQLVISLIAQEGAAIVGHVAISPVTISPSVPGWYGLGPLSVRPHYQGRGIGSQLVRAALTELQQLGGRGCVVLGEPMYYERFGFQAHSTLQLPGVPAEYFQALPFGDRIPVGIVSYSEAFTAKG